MKINYNTRIGLLVLTFLCSFLSWGQTNPAAQTLPYTQNFASLTGASPVYPAGWQGWNVTGTINNTSYVTTVPNADQAISVQTNATAPGALIGDFIGKIGVMSTGNATTGQKTICLSINTTALTSIAVSYNAATQRTENTRQNGLGLQYRLGTSGAFTNVASSEYLNQLSPNTTGTGSVSVQNIAVTLPVTCDNQAVVQLRWVIRDATGSGNRPGFSIDDVSVSGTPISSNTITTSAITGSPFCVTSSTGASVSVPFTSTGTFTGNTYTAQLSNSAGSFGTPVNIGTLVSDLNSGTITATIPVGTAAGTGYRIRVVSNNPAITGSDNTVNLTVQNAATISTQPATTVQNLCQSGASTALSVVATGTTLTYQWYSNITATNSGGTPVGTSSASYTPVTTTAGTLYYYCVVSAVCGVSVTSNVSGAVNVTAIPAAPSGTINVSANPSCGAATLSYSSPSAAIYWQTTAGGISTANNSLTNYTSSTTAGSYTIYVRELSGSCWSAATSVNFTVAAPVNITVQPTNQSAFEGNTATFTVTASNATSYQWQVNTGSGFVNIGTNSNTYTTPATTLAMSGYLYQVIPSGNAPCGSVTSSVATLNVTTGPCLSANFDASTTVPSGWTNSDSTNDAVSSHYSSAPNCRALASGSNIISDVANNPTSISFYVDASGSGGQVGTLEYRVGAGAWTFVNNFTATTVGATETFNLTSSPNLSVFSSVSFRISSAGNTIYIDNMNVFCSAPCTPATVTTTPSSGPVGTEITITATSGSLTGASVSFGAINAAIVSNNGTQMVVLVPSGATTGTITITDSQPCDATTSFTVISNDNTSCEGASSITDLIIYDIHDEQTGSGGFITLYNGTALTVDLTNYTLWRAGDYGIGYADYATLAGTIAPGALGILKVSVGSCGPASTNGTIDGGFNENDGIQLRNAAGTVVVDDVHTYISGPGYYMVRNAGALTARTSYVAADWSTITLIAGECYPSAGLTLPSGGAISPVVTTHPSYTPSCGSTSAMLTTTGTEGFAGGNSLAYQWYFAVPGSATWAAVADGGIYSGATSASLNISVITGVINYQYYCQIRENSATCYSASNAIKITDSGASTWNGTIWVGGTPTINKAAIIDGTYVTATNGNFSCCSLTVNSGVGRSLTISSSGYVEVQNNITNNGILDVLNNGSLVQISDVAVNTGNITYNRTANIRRQDYVYWSSPVAGFNNTAISPTTPTGFQYKWLPTTAGINNFGNWTYANETMVLGKGYIVRGPNAFSLTTLANYTATFTGVPNNGVITTSISRGTYNGVNYTTGVSTTPGTKDDDNWNLVGNPYPSAIHAIDFLTLNTNIDGFVNIWTHGTLPSNPIIDPFYNNYAYNYTPGDYITYNASGASSGPGAFNGRIAGGQGFFVSMLHTSTATTENVMFNNSLRNIAHNNGQFFRNANATTSTTDLERNRIWLDLVTPTGTSVRSMFGYIENATNGKDRLFDAFSNEKLSFNIFSLLENEQLLIQGKTLPFDNNDKVNIGVSIPQDGLYKIALGAVDGLFSNVNQNIYLEDKLLNVIYDLRTTPYSFTATEGIVENRFVIRYTNTVVLANELFDATQDVLVVSNQELSVVSTKEKMANIIVFDVLGRKLFEGKDMKTNEFILPVSKHNVPLIIEIGLENGIRINKKIVY